VSWGNVIEAGLLKDRDGEWILRRSLVYWTVMAVGEGGGCIKADCVGALAKQNILPAVCTVTASFLVPT
jgi:hypothetical protein